MRYSPKTARDSSGGFTLVEVLITLVILSIGLLGLAAMQLVGLRSNSGANNRTIAVAVASDIVERMNANPVGVGLGAYVLNDSSGTVCTNTPAEICADYKDTGAHVDALSCSPTQMARFDLYVVACGGITGAGVDSVDRTTEGLRVLNNSSFTITCGDGAGVCNVGSPYTVTVRWQELQADQSVVQQSISVPFIPYARP